MGGFHFLPDSAYLILCLFSAKRISSVTIELKRLQGILRGLKNQLSFFLKNIPTPIKAGISRLMINRKMEALNPTEAV